MGWRGLLLLALLCGGLLFALQQSEREKEGDLPTDPVLAGRRLQDARRIRIRSTATSEVIELSRDDAGQFTIDEPVRDLASEATIRALAAVYDGSQLIPEYEAEETSDELLEQTGLREPRARIELEYDDGAHIELDLGEEGPYGHDIYALRDGRIFRVQKALFTSLQVNPDEFREPFVLRNTAQHVQSVEIDRRSESGGREVIRIERHGNRPYRMIQPKDVRLDQGRVHGFVRGIVSLRAERFLPGLRQQVGPDSPADVILEVSGMAGVETVELRQTEGGMLIGEAQPRGITFTCSATDYQSLFQVPMQALRAYWLVPFSMDEARSIVLDPGPGRGAALELARGNLGEFEMRQPVSGLADPNKVSELLQAFKSLAVVEFVEDDAGDLAKYGLDGEPFTIRVTKRGPEEVVQLGDQEPESGNCYVRRADEAQVVTIPGEVARIMRRPWIEYAHRDVTKFSNRSLVRRVIVRDVDGETVYERDDGGIWRPAAGGEEVAILQEVVDLLSHMTAVEVLAREDVGQLPPPRTVELQTASGDLLHTLTLYRRADGRVLAVGENAELVYLLAVRDGADLWELR